MASPAETRADPRAGLAALLRAGSEQEHRDAEGEPFLRDLLAGRVAPAGYLAFLTRLTAVYDALESTGALLADDPCAAAVLDPALHRAGTLRLDLATWWRLAGRDLAALDVDREVAATVAGSAATAAYVARIRASVAWGGHYVAHHYTRYLGDLSGGQVLGRVLSRTFGLHEGHGVRFYAFPRVPRTKPYKDAYRARLDALRLDPDEQVRVVEEVQVAFRLNQRLLAELARPEPAPEPARSPPGCPARLGRVTG